MAKKEEEPTIEQLIERLRRIEEMSARLPAEFQTFQNDIAKLHEQLRRAQQPQEKIDPE
jgi:hypothetical protein